MLTSRNCPIIDLSKEDIARNSCRCRHKLISNYEVGFIFSDFCLHHTDRRK
jgi:hypothetical protein